MKKIFLVFLIFCLFGCTSTEEVDYSKYIQINEIFTANDVEMKITNIYLNPLDNMNTSKEKIVTIEFDFVEGYIESKNCFLNIGGNLQSYYTIDGLDYLVLDTDMYNKIPYIRFKVNKDLNDVLLNIKHGDELVEVYLQLPEVE